MKRMTGQALVEFALLSFVFVLLGAGLHVIGRMQAIQRQSVLAARHLAFRQAWSAAAPAPDPQLQSLRTRHFGNPGWTDPAGRLRLLAPADVSMSLAEAEAPGRAAGLAAHFVSALSIPGGFLNDGLSFGSPGYRVAGVTVAIPPLRGWAPFDVAELQFTQRAAILGNPWNASGPAQVRARAAGLVPTSLLREQAALLRPFTAALSLLEPSLEQLCLGLIEPDHVPADRLLPVPVAATAPACQ